MTLRYILVILKLVIALLWPITVSAAVVTGAVDPFTGITGMHVLVLSIISTLSGLTALTIRIDSELKQAENSTLSRPTLFVSSHMLGSWLAGVLAVAVSQINNYSVWSQISIVIAASFSGARFVERVSEFYISKAIKDE
jgi:cell shape-determining protein MreD